MTIIKKIWNFCGSRNLSVYIFITGLVYFFFLLAFGAVIPSWGVANLSKLLPFKVLYILFFINLIICEIKWVPVVLRRCRRPEMPEMAEDLGRFRERIEVRSQESGVRSLEKYLRRRGYKVQRPGARGQGPVESGASPLTPPSSLILHAYSGRFSPIGNILFHISFLFLLAGVFVSLNYRFELKALLMEGQEFVGAVYAKEDAGNQRKFLKDMRFEVKEILPRFWGGEMLFTGLKSLISHDGREDVAKLSSGINIHGARVTIEGLSYTPKYVLRDLEAGVMDVGYVNLANFVTGSVDDFNIPGFPYKIYVSIYPDFEKKDGKLATNSMNLLNPKLFIKVVRGKMSVYSGLIGLRDEAYFDGLGLSFPEIKYNGAFKVVKDPGEWLVWAGFVLMGTGLIWKLLFYRREVSVNVFGGKVYLSTYSDYYGELNAQKVCSFFRC